MSKKKVKRIVYPAILYIADLLCYRRFVKQLKATIKRLNIKRSNLEGIDKYYEKWRKLDKRVEKYSYILYSTFIGNTPDIVPENIGHRRITPALNPPLFAEFYSDKNMYELYMADINMPKVFARRVDGGKLVDKDFKPLNKGILGAIPADCQKVVLKPSVDTDSGVGVMIFKRLADGEWRSIKENETLSDHFLQQYKWDFVIQEALVQHPFLSQFCPTSINTLRIYVYKSVVDDEIHLLNSVMRIGKNGSVVDNAHAGGVMVAIDEETGVMDKNAIDANYNKYDEWNGISFKDNEYIVPDWDKITTFAKRVASKNVRCHLFALDITIDKDGNPILIESNIKNYAYWMAMVAGKSTFGRFTDEIIDYCASHRPEKVKFLL
jgi:hypothetical protein